MRIGVVDSGVGGITTLKVLADNIPAEYYYYMDNAHVPYGDKSPRELMSIARGIMDRLMSISVDIIVLACNTLSAVAGESLRRIYDAPIVCIEPSILPASRVGGRTLVLATPNTAHSEKFLHLLRSHDNMRIVAINELATLIENNELEKAQKRVEQELAGGIYDNIVLGCTHYVYLKEYLEGRGYRVFEGNDGVRRRLEYLIAHMSGRDTYIKTSIALHSTMDTEMNRIIRYLERSITYW